MTYDDDMPRAEEGVEDVDDEKGPRKESSAIGVRCQYPCQKHSKHFQNQFYPLVNIQKSYCKWSFIVVFFPLKKW